MRRTQGGRFYIGEMVVLGALALVALVLSLWLWPKYRVYSQQLSGEAKLREAEWSKRILIEEARAQEQAALLQAQAKVTIARAHGQAEVERARATAEANRIIGASLQENEAYLRYLWILGLKDGNGERIYIPTEAGLPILEAGELRKP